MSERNVISSRGTENLSTAEQGVRSHKSFTDEELYEEIFTAIVENKLKAGARLGQEELGRVFGVSKTRIRPILRLLAERGLVTLKPMKGAFVAKPLVEDALAVNSARQIIEEGIVRSAARGLPKGRIDELRELVTAEQEARSNGEIAKAHRFSGRFHIALACAVGQSVLESVLRELVSRDSLVVALYGSAETSGCSANDHMEILEQIIRADGETAAARMRQHLSNVKDGLHLSEEPDGGRQLKHAFRHLEAGRGE